MSNHGLLGHMPSAMVVASNVAEPSEIRVSEPALLYSKYIHSHMEILSQEGHTVTEHREFTFSKESPSRAERTRLQVTLCST